MQAVAALVEGRDREDVAAMLKVSLKAVDGWWAKWLSGGWEALTACPRGRRVGEHQALSVAEQAAVRQAILDHQPCDRGLRGQLWTRALVGELIAKLYRVCLTAQGVGKYLRRWACRSSAPTNAPSSRTWQRCAAGGSRPSRPFARRRRPRTPRCSSPTRSASAPITSPAAPGARRAALRSCAAPATASRSTPSQRSAPRAASTSWSSPSPSTRGSCAASWTG